MDIYLFSGVIFRIDGNMNGYQILSGNMNLEQQGFFF